MKKLLVLMLALQSVLFAGATSRAITQTAISGEAVSNDNSMLFYRDCNVTPCVDRRVGSLAPLPVLISGAAVTVTATIGVATINANTSSIGLDGGANTIGTVNTIDPNSPDTFKRLTGVATASVFTLWTPQTGKKFRLEGIDGRVTANAANSGGAATVTVTFFDGATTITTGSLHIPASSSNALTGNIEFISRGYDYWRAGYVSSAINTPLTVSLNGALTSGQIDIFTCGKEQ